MVVLEYLTFSCTSTAHCQPYIPGYSLWSLAAKPDTDVNYNKQLNVIEYETQKEEVKVGHTFSFFDPQFLRTFSFFFHKQLSLLYHGRHPARMPMQYVNFCPYRCFQSLIWRSISFYKPRNTNTSFCLGNPS